MAESWLVKLSLGSMTTSKAFAKIINNDTTDCQEHLLVPRILHLLFYLILQMTKGGRYHHYFQILQVGKLSPREVK